MSELVSAYPRAGGIYWWAAELGGAVWGWFNLIGLVAVVASVDYACATFTRDRAIPSWRIWTRLNHNRVPVAFLAVVSIAVGTVILAVGVWWLVSARRTFTGPVRTVEFAGEGLGVQTDEPAEPTPAYGVSSARDPRG